MYINSFTTYFIEEIHIHQASNTDVVLIMLGAPGEWSQREFFGGSITNGLRSFIKLIYCECFGRAI